MMFDAPPPPIITFNHKRSGYKHKARYYSGLMAGAGVAEEREE